MKVIFIKDMHYEIPKGTVFIGNDEMDSPFKRTTDIYEHSGGISTYSTKNKFMPEYNIKYALKNGYAVIEPTKSLNQKAYEEIEALGIKPNETE